MKANCLWGARDSNPLRTMPPILQTGPAHQSPATPLTTHIIYNKEKVSSKLRGRVRGLSFYKFSQALQLYFARIWFGRVRNSLRRPIEISLPRIMILYHTKRCYISVREYMGIGQIIGKFSSGGKNALPGILQASAMELAQSREHGVGVFPRPAPSRATQARLYYIASGAFHCATA